MSRRARIAIGLLLAVAAPALGTDDHAFRSRACGIRFALQSGWQVQPDPDGPSCALTLSPPPDREIVMASPGTPDQPCHLGSVRIVVYRRSLEDTATASGFTREDGQWHFMPGSVFDHVDSLNGNGWRGLHTASTSHYCGAAQETHEFLVGHGSRSASIGVHGTNVTVVEHLLPTIVLQP